MADDTSNKPPIPEVKLVDSSDTVEVLKDVIVPDKFFNRLLLGVPVLDELFGGPEYPGLLPGCSILWTGGPGAGKSTGALQITDMLAAHAERNCLYNCGEEDKRMVKMRADRLGITGNFGISHFYDVDKLVGYCTGNGIEVLIVDSIQQLTIEGMEDSELKLLKAVGRKLHRLAHDYDTTVIVIGQVTKGGEFAGPMKLKHDLDIHAHLRLNPDTMARELLLTKNRFGPAGIPYECNLTARGLDFANAKAGDPVADEKGGSKASDRKDATVKLIKDELLKGERISGYCFARFPDPITKEMGVKCSGNLWRSFVEVARKQLEAEYGETLTEVDIDNRRHVFVRVDDAVVEVMREQFLAGERVPEEPPEESEVGKLAWKSAIRRCRFDLEGEGHVFGAGIGEGKKFVMMES